MLTSKTAAFILASALAATCASADSIVMDGDTLSGVYIRSSASMYYIQNPRDGSTLNVLKADVPAKAVRISRSRKERAAILAAWKRKNGIADKPKTQAVHKRAEPILLDPPASIQAAMRDDADAETLRTTKKSRVTMLTNLPSKVARQKSGRKVFVNSNGTRIMTNDPSRFYGSDEFVEVVLDYETIEIPTQFKSTTTNHSAAKPFSNLDDIVTYYARYYNVNAHLIYAVITAESSGNPYAVSPAGARGLMQLMPGTAQEMGVNDIFDPVENVAGGTQYLSKLLKLYDGKSSLALAGYNAGPGNVKKYGGIPPFNETKDYIRRVLQYERQYRRHGAPTFDMADAIPVDNSYLPPSSSKYYQLVLENGLTVRAENISDNGTHYAYIFEGRSGRIRKDQVRKIYEPS